MTNNSAKAKLPDAVYCYFYSLPHITPKQLANLICDNDPRGIPLKYVHSKFKKTLEQITYAFKCLAKSELDTQELFRWAINKHPDFREKLPTNMIINTGSCHAEFSPMTSQSFALDLPTDYQELSHKYCLLYIEILELKKENMELKSRLSVLEKKKKAKLVDSATGGKNSRAGLFNTNKVT